MKVLQGEKNVRSIKSNSVLLETTDLAEVEEELTTWAILQYKEQLSLALESVVHLDNERVLDIFKYPSLGHRMLHLISPNDVGLFQLLDGVKNLSVFLLDEGDLAVRSLSDNAYQLKVLHAYLGAA